MLSVVCYRWRPVHGYRSTFNAETVNALFAMVRRHYTDPFRAICVTDDASGIDRDIEAVSLWSDHAGVPSPHGGRNPACYRRLKAFAPQMRDVLGDRIVTLDLDMVFTGDLRPLWNRPEDVVLLRDPNHRHQCNGSMVLQTVGARADVWEKFDPATSPRMAKDAGYKGSDQAWISYVLGDQEAMWDGADGVYSFRHHILPSGKLPNDARVVSFHGQYDPGSSFAQRFPWVRESYPIPARVA